MSNSTAPWVIQGLIQQGWYFQCNWAFAFYETTFQPWHEARIHCWASLDLPSHPLHITSSPNCKAHSGLYDSLIGPRELSLSWHDKFWLEDFCVPNSLHNHPLEIMYIYTPTLQQQINSAGKQHLECVFSVSYGIEQVNLYNCYITGTLLFSKISMEQCHCAKT